MLALFTTLLLHSFSYATSVPREGFQSGTHFLQEQKYDEAFARFEDESARGHDSATLFYNWGLAAYRLQKKGLAVGLWRRALYVDPELSRAHEALRFISLELPRDPFINEASTWTALRKNIFERVDLNKLLAASWVLLLAAGILLIRYAGARRRALQTEKPLPRTPYEGYILALSFFVALALSGGKGLTLLETRATVTSSSASLRTGPGLENNIIFDLIEGLDVVVKQVRDSWAQVTVASGVSGWVPTETLFQHTGKNRLW